MQEIIARRPNVQAAQEDEMIDLPGLLRTLWAGKIRIAAVTLAFVSAGAIYAWLVATPVFKATSVVMIESRQTSVVGLDSVLGNLSTSNTVIKTETEVLRGRTLLGTVVDKLDLTSDPDFNAALRPPRLRQKLRAWIGGPTVDSRTAAERAEAEREGAISALLGRLEITNVPGSLVFQITLEASDGHKASAMADAVAQAYIDDQLRVRFDATEQATSWLTNQLAALQKGLEQAETALRRYQSETALIDAGTLTAMDRQLKETRSRRDEAGNAAKALSGRLARIDAAKTPLDRAIASGDEALVRLMQAADGDAGPQLDRMRERLAQDLARAEAQARSLGEAANTLEADIARQSQELIRLDQLTREAESSRLLYDHFQTRLKETSAQLGMQQADSLLLSRAVVPWSPAAPRKMLILAMAGATGVMLGMLWTLLREIQSRSIRSARDLERLTGRIVLAQVPEIPGRSRKAALDWLAQHPTSAPAEAVRNLRTSILLSSVDKEPQVVVMTSSLPGEGKTTLTAAMAQNLTAMGRKVLVIEGDIRNNTMSRQLAGDLPEGAPGLVAAIRDTGSLADMVHSTPTQGDILPGGNATVGAVDLFSSQAFGRLILAARGIYDMVLIDTPPVLAVPDARVIAQHADATVFIVRWDKTSRDQVSEALQQLEMVNVRVAGIVLSQVSASGMAAYSYGYGYGYGKSYGNALKKG